MNQNIKSQRVYKAGPASLLAVTLTASALIACGGPQRKDGPNVQSGLRTAGKGLVHIVLSPIQIAAGALEGVSSLPYFAATGLHQINKQLNESQAKVTLSDTYASAYGKNFAQVDADGDTGQSFSRMRNATGYFQKILKRKGVPNADRYLLTSIDTAKSDGHILFAVVYRPQAAITVIDKHDGRTRRQYDASDSAYYEPFARNAAGRELDTVVDYGAVPVDQIRTQKMQAILLTFAANSVVRQKRAPDYWQIERRWLNGEHQSIVQNKNEAIRERMQI
ncbi:MAG: hypothetical protein NXI24_22265 [bacterium]|nr:hypothetical protein [bacterium]